MSPVPKGFEEQPHEDPQELVCGYGHTRYAYRFKSAIYQPDGLEFSAVTIRLTLYVDQAIIRAKDGTLHRGEGIDNTPILCQVSYFLLEYARTTMFLWMFIEGLYLHNVVTVTVFQGRFPHTIYAIVGWGSPFCLSIIWAVITIKYKVNQE